MALARCTSTKGGWYLNLRETVRGRHGVSTGSGSDRVANLPTIQDRDHENPVATAPGTDLILKLKTLTEEMEKMRLVPVREVKPDASDSAHSTRTVACS